MKNALIYNYNIYINDLQKINDDYYFSFQNNNYVLSVFSRDIYEAVSIYKLNQEMIQNKIKTYIIILTKDNNILFLYNDIYYILMIIPNIKNREIELDDIISFNYFPINQEIYKLDKSNWPFYWENKIDFIENQLLTIKSKYQIINETINYYIGLWENGIAYYNYFLFNNIDKQISHKRVNTDMDYLTFLNPLNLIVDYKERDVSEYLKSFVLNKKFTFNDLENIFSKLNLNKEKVALLIARILFVSEYFDMYEDILNAKVNEKEILNVTNKNKSIIWLLKFIFKKYEKYNIPIIEWIIKE